MSNLFKLQKLKSIQTKMSQLVLSYVFQLVEHLLLRFINWQMKPIKTSVTLRIRVWVVVLLSFDRKPNQLVTIALEILEPQNRHPRGPSDIV